MTAASDVIAQALQGIRLLDHPFYVRWQRGELSRDDLRDYASQYRHFEAMLPTFLEELVRVAPTPARDAVAANLSDELGPPTHLELFDQFVDELGADAADPTPATTELLGAYASLLRDGSATALAGLAAYEIQAAGIATTKADGLRTHYGIRGDGLRFWDVHGVTEDDHAAWTLDALESLGSATADVSSAAEAVATAWWGFLDERERVVQTQAV